jgi:hypothetical protein
MFSLSYQGILNIRKFLRKTYTSYKFKYISMQNNNSWQTCFQHKNNDKKHDYKLYIQTYN